MAAEYCVRLQNISKRFAGVIALDKVELSLKHNHIHCLAGENGSGKSTLIKILSGALQPEEGAYFEIDGKTVHTMTSIESIHDGIAVIYQDLSLFPNLTVAENITAERFVSEKRKLVNKKEVFSIAREIMDKLGVNLPLDETVDRLSIGDQQLVAICRALTRDLKLLIMDEPTAALTRKEVNSLFAIIKDLQKKGISTLFVSHKLDEVFEIAEEVTIIRDGKVLGTYSMNDLDGNKLTFLMTGKKITYSKHQRACDENSSLLRIEHLTKKENYKDIDLCLAAGEIVGITGLLGSGRTELALSLFGMNKPDSGNVFMNGKRVRITSVEAAMKLGIGYVPENRLLNGLVMSQSVGKNIIITILDRLLNKMGLIDLLKSGEVMKNWVEELAIKIPGLESEARTLSGGNQQRVVLAKWLATNPRVLILDGPTVGIDVAAKESIHGIVRKLSEKNLGILLISDEVPEVYNNCDRVIVMHKGQFIEEFDTATAQEHEIQDCINKAV